MPANEIFEVSTRPNGDKAGVFESDGEAASFYLCDVHDGQAAGIVASILIPISAEISTAEINIVWDKSHEMVALFIREDIVAVFDVERHETYGATNTSAESNLIDAVRARFRLM